MPNTKSAKKMNRKIKKTTLINNSRENRIRTLVKKLREIIKLGDKKAAQEYFEKTQPEIHKGVTKGVLTLNKASRIISRLCANVKSM